MRITNWREPACESYVVYDQNAVTLWKGSARGDSGWGQARAGAARRSFRANAVGPHSDGHHSDEHMAFYLYPNL